MNLTNLSKKISIWTLLFCYTTTMLFAGGYIKKGETFVASEDVRYMNYDESVKAFEERKELLRLRKEVAAFESVVADLQESIKKYEQAAEKDQQAIQDYKNSIAKNESAIEDYKRAIGELKTSNTKNEKQAVIYQEVVTTQTQALKNALVSIGNVKRKNRFERKFYYFLGLATPFIVGAAANNLKKTLTD